MSSSCASLTWPLAPLRLKTRLNGSSYSFRAIVAILLTLARLQKAVVGAAVDADAHNDCNPKDPAQGPSEQCCEQLEWPYPSPSLNVREGVCVRTLIQYHRKTNK